MDEENKKSVDKELEYLIKKGNGILKHHLKRYGYLRGFKKPLKGLLRNELDGGDERIVSAFELNDYRMPR